MFNQKMTPDRAISCILNKDQQYIKNWKETVTALLDGFMGEQPSVPATSEEEPPSGGPQDSPCPKWTKREVMSAITSLRSGKTPGLDNIEADMIKNLTKTLVIDNLVALFNTCRKLEYFPDVWKNANLRILLKGQDKDETQYKS